MADGESGRTVYTLDNREKSNEGLPKLGSWSKFKDGIYCRSMLVSPVLEVLKPNELGGMKGMWKNSRRHEKRLVWSRVSQ